jgi:hypothetical protein
MGGSWDRIHRPSPTRFNGGISPEISQLTPRICPSTTRSSAIAVFSREFLRIADEATLEMGAWASTWKKH